MRLPTIYGTIERRILVNFRIDPEIAAWHIPAPFKPQLHNGYAVGGVCLIRLADLRPAFIPKSLGLHSENAAYRFAVSWESEGREHFGVFIPRRDTSSHLNAAVGGRIFPGEHHLSDFTVTEQSPDFSVAYQSRDKSVNFSIQSQLSTSAFKTPLFENLGAASRFFEAGSLGYSVTHNPGEFDGLELACENWEVKNLTVQAYSSNYFENHQLFPPGSLALDHALLMQDIPHQWHSKPTLGCSAT